MNLKKSMKTTCRRRKQIRSAHYLSRYDFNIDYCLKIKNLADVLSRSFIDEDTEKNWVEQNRKILDKRQHFLSKSNYSLLNINPQAVTQSTICNEKNYSWKHCIKRLKILIAGILVTLKLKRPWSLITGFL